MDEQELRGGLRTLTAGQPALSEALAERSARQYRVTRRRHRALAAAGVAAALVAAVPAVVALRAPEAKAPAAAVASWPDARDPAWVATGDRALAEFERVRPHDVPAGATVRWLYAGLVPSTDEAVVAAWAYCLGKSCPTVVLANGFRHQVTDLGDEDVWSFDVGFLPSTGPEVPVSTYLNGPRGAHGPTTVVFALASPKTRRLGWESPRLRPRTGGTGVLTRQGGAFIGDVGYVSGPVSLLLAGRTPVPVGVADSVTPVPVGNVPMPDPVVLPSSYRFVEGGASQLRDDHESFHQGSFAGRRLAMWARCEGSAPVRVTYLSRPYFVTCDGAVHLTFADQPGGDVLIVAFSSTDPYTGLAYAIGYR